MSDEAWVFWYGVVVVLIMIFGIAQFAESVCQAKHNVADCEWSQSPFTPSVQVQP